MKKRITSLLLVLAMCFAMLPTAAFAAEGEENAMPKYSGGSGTKENPWLISTVEDLKTLAQTVNDGNAAGFDADCEDVGDYHGYYFKQTVNLDLSELKESWDPIGYSGGEGRYFAGNYDGDGHTISNITSTGKQDGEGYSTASIFGWAAFGSVKNLYVENANFTAAGERRYSYAGGVVAVAYGSTIENCSAKNSQITSNRAPDNNNCAGGIAGYSTGGTFIKCASISNTIQSQAYAGGFVGEIDDDYGVGDTTFNACNTVNCSVTATTEDVQGTSCAGGFAGEMTASKLTLTNCYVYKTTLFTEGSKAHPICSGIFAGNLWGGSTIQANNCFYGECNVTEGTGSATEKTAEEFSNGTVAGSLGGDFVQVDGYPIPNGPGDYSAVDAAIAEVNGLNEDNYKDFSAVKKAVDAVVRGKMLSEQNEINAMAQAIKEAIAALEYKDADYTAVDAAIEKANALNKSNYRDFSAVDKAVNDVVRGKNITEQSEVDKMAKAIEDAIAGLVRRSSSSGGSSKTTYPVNTPTADNGTAAVSPKNAAKGDTVTITVTPDSGYKVDKVTATDANGNTITVTDKGNGKYTFNMPAGKVTITPTFVKIAEQPTEKTFVDVAKSDWFADAVAYVTEKGLMNGTGSDTFSPNASTTRGMLMTVLARYAGADTTGSTPWYQKGMDWAKANGVSDGTNPEVNITREQLVTMLYRYAGSPAANGSLSDFADASAVSSYAVNAMQWAVENGIVNGSNGKLNPKNNATRAEVAAILMRYCEMGK